MAAQISPSMNKKHSDSIFPIGIGASFVAVLFLILAAGTVIGFLVGDRFAVKQLGGVGLLFAFLVLLVGPLFYIRKKSPFEQGKVLRMMFDGMGVIQGLRGTFLRLLLYDDGLEIRAFYHRYYIPFNQIKKVRIAPGRFNTRINLETGIKGVPDYINSSGEQFSSLALLLEKKVQPDQANFSAKSN